jgi:hypothetical protein
VGLYREPVMHVLHDFGERLALYVFTFGAKSKRAAVCCPTTFDT